MTGSAGLAAFNSGAHNTNAYGGSSYGASYASAPGGSIYQDITATVQVGQSYCASGEFVTDGTATGGGGTLSVSLLGQTNSESSSISFSNLPNRSSWTPESTCVTATSAHNIVRVQIWPTYGGPEIGMDAIDTQAKGFGAS